MKYIYTLFLLATYICGYCQFNKTLSNKFSIGDLGKAQLGEQEAMFKIRESLDPYNPDDIPMLYYWTTKLCSRKVLRLENPEAFLSFLEQNLENDLMKTSYALFKIFNLEEIADDNFRQQNENLLYHKITPKQYLINVAESPIFANERLGINLLKECAHKNSYAAQELADYFLREESVKDWDEAIKYYSISLENDPSNSSALSTLSHCFYHGYGIKQNILKAVEYWERLYSMSIFWAEWEHRDLRYLLGKIYKEGVHVPKNEGLSMKFFNEGANADDAECLFAIGNIAYEQKEYDKSFIKYKQALSVPNYWNNSISDIYIALSRAYRFGHGVKQNTDSATYYWDKAKKLSNDRTTQVEILTLDENYKAQIIKPDMIFVRGGNFTMGATQEQKPAAYKEEYPSRKLFVSDFYIGKYEVTQEEWLKIMGYNPSENKGVNLPVDNVSWIEVHEFINRLNKITGEEYYLPTETEWEYAARGGVNHSNYRYIGGDNLDEIAWYSGNSNDTSHPVGSKKPNSLGIYDMAGNIWEWCEDWENGYGIADSSDSFNCDNIKVRRGGSYSYFEWGCRAAFRGSANKGYKFKNTGFRLCKRAN